MNKTEIEAHKKYYDNLILNTPTGKTRNILTDIRNSLDNLIFEIEIEEMNSDEGKPEDRYHR